MEIVKHIQEGNLETIEVFVDNLFNIEIDEALSIIQEVYSQIEHSERNDTEEYFLLVLQGFWHFFQAQISVFEKADFQQGLINLNTAKEVFSNLQIEEVYSKIIEGFELYFSAIVDLRTFNLSSGIEKIEKTKEYFSNLDKYGKTFELQIEAVEAESLFITGIHFIAQSDIEKGQMFIEKAANSSKKIAKKHYVNDEQGYNLFMGLGFHYQSLSNFYLLIKKFDSFDFDYFEYTDNEILEYSRRTILHFTKCLEVNEIVRMNLKISKGLNLLSQTIFGIGKNTHKLLSDENDKVFVSNKELKNLIKNSRKLFIDTGEMGQPFVKMCNQYESQINNIQKYLRQKKSIINKENIETKSLESKDLIRQKIQARKTKAALEILLNEAINYDITNEAILIHSRYAALRNNNIIGVIKDEQFRMEETKILQSILTLLDSDLEY